MKVNEVNFEVIRFVKEEVGIEINYEHLYDDMIQFGDRREGKVLTIQMINDNVSVYMECMVDDVEFDVHKHRIDYKNIFDVIAELNKKIDKICA